MSEIRFGWCNLCGTWKYSEVKGLFSKRYTGNCERCGTKLTERSSVNESTNKRASDTTSDMLSTILISNALNDTYHKHDSYHGNGGSFGGGGASSSWDSSDSSSSSSDSGSSGGGD